MSVFPTKQAEISRLAVRMIDGFQNHASNFPHVNWIFLMIAYAQFRGGVYVQLNARAAVAQAAADRRQKLNALRKVMKECLKKSKVDTKADPKKMALIGYPVTNWIGSLEPPNCPRNLWAITQSPGTVKLCWDKPENGGTVENYVIEKRAKSTGTVSVWQLIESCYDSQIELLDQPTGVRLEYRILSSNKAGKSLPSNVVEVIL